LRIFEQKRFGRRWRTGVRRRWATMRRNRKPHDPDVMSWFLDPPIAWFPAGHVFRPLLKPVAKTGYYVAPYCSFYCCGADYGPFPTLGAARAWARRLAYDPGIELVHDTSTERARARRRMGLPSKVSVSVDEDIDAILNRL